jgi:hypothetical protein
MWKYGVALLLAFGLAIYISIQDKRAIQQSTQHAEHLNKDATIAKANGDHAEENVPDSPRNLPSWYGFFRWPNGTTVWAVILTLLAIAEQTAQTARAAKATEKAVEISDKALDVQKDTAKRQLRAYMVVRNARLFLHEDGAVEAKMELANCGQTPAYDLRGGTFCEFALYPIQDPGVPPEKLRQSQSIIGAGLAVHLLAAIGRHDKEDREHLLTKLSTTGNNLVYRANGYFTYRDIFKDTHYIKFQMIVGGPSGKPRIDEDDSGIYAVFSNDSVGNDAD